MRVTAAAAVARAEVRRHWLRLVGLGIATGLAGGAVVGLLAGARRTESAFDRLVRATRSDFDFSVSVLEPTILDEVLALPGVTRHRTEWGTTGRVSDPARPERRNEYGNVVSAPRDMQESYVLVRGRAPAPGSATEVAVSETLAFEQGVDVGTKLHWRALTRKDFLAFAEGTPAATGFPELDLEIVGVVRDVRGAAQFRPVGAYGTPAFHHLVPEGEFSLVTVQLAVERGRVDEVREHLDALVTSTPSPARGFSALEVTDVHGPYEAARNGMRTQARGLLVAALVVVLGAGFGVGQAIDRRIARGEDDDRVLSAVGLVRSARVLARGLPLVLSAAVAMPLAVGVAAASSAYTPIGSARRAEPEPGLLVDWRLTAAGAAAVGAFVAAAASGSVALRVRRGARTTAPTRSALADRVAAAGAPGPLAVGVRLALEPGLGATRVPVRSTLAGVTVAVAGVVATATVASSLDRLLDTPARFGSPGDLQVLNLTPEAVDALLADPRAAQITRQLSGGARVGDRDVIALAFEPIRGHLQPTVLAGRLSRNGEVMLGPELAEELDVGIGDAVLVPSAGGAKALRFEVVGTALTSAGDTPTRAAVFTPADLAMVQSREPFVEALVAAADTLDEHQRAAFAADLSARWEIRGPQVPLAVQNLKELRGIPPAVTAALVLLGAAAVAHGIGSSVRRRRRDLAVLRTIGFVRRRIAATVLTAATTVAAFGLLIGLPAGLALGAAAWSRIAGSVFVATDPLFPVTLVALLVPLTLGLALVVAAIPSRRAARLRPAEILRGE